MLAIKVTCPGCGKVISAPSSRAGTTGECPACRRTLTIPWPESDDSDRSVQVARRRSPPPVAPVAPAPAATSPTEKPPKERRPTSAFSVASIMFTIFGGLAGFFGSVVLNNADTIMQEIFAGLCFVVAAVFMVGAIVVSYLKQIAGYLRQG